MVEVNVRLTSIHSIQEYEKRTNTSFGIPKEHIQKELLSSNKETPINEVLLIFNGSKEIDYEIYFEGGLELINFSKKEAFKINALEGLSNTSCWLEFTDHTEEDESLITSYLEVSLAIALGVIKLILV